MSDQDSTDNITNTDKIKNIDVEEIKTSSTIGLNNQDKFIKKEHISCEEMLKQKLSPFRKTKTLKNPPKPNCNIIGLSIKPTSKDISKTSIGVQNKCEENKKKKKNVRFNDEIGKNLIEFIDIECVKDFNIHLENENTKTLSCRCTDCLIF